MTLCTQSVGADEHSGVLGNATCPPLQRVDEVCLNFCIALLDHELKGDMLESVVLGYLAVLRIGSGNSTFYGPLTYTFVLSGFIKIGQMLVLQKAVQVEETGRGGYAFDLLDEMKERFMTVDNRTPLSWAVSLRSFGKHISDAVTSFGYIQWSEDEQTIFYKALELKVDDCRSFVPEQVRQVQTILKELF